eukprot:jgi/Botrbrau1/20716/Bobra.0058s0045.1
MGLAGRKLDVDTLEAIAGEAPCFTFPRQEVLGAQLSSLLVASGFQPSKAAVRRLIKGGGVQVNNRKIEDEAIRGGGTGFNRRPPHVGRSGPKE